MTDSTPPSLTGYANAPHIALVSTAANGALGHAVQRALLALGCKVSWIPYPDWKMTSPGWTFRGAGAINRALLAASRPVAEARLIAELVRVKPEAVLILKCDDLHLATWTALTRVIQVPIAVFHPDDPWNRGTALQPGPAHPRAEIAMAHADRYFLWSHALVERAKKQTRRAVYLPFACDPEDHARVTLTPEEEARFASEVVFIGNWDEKREAWLAPLAEAKLGLQIWGTPYWGTRAQSAAVRACYRGATLYGREQSVAIAASKIAINILRVQNKGATNMRTFELPCMGAFMLHERSPEAAAFFPPGIAMSDFGSPDELVTRVAEWLQAPASLRRQIADEGHRRALQWTYRDWCEQILIELGLLPEGPTGEPIAC